MPRIDYPDIGICGLSCKLCPRYHTDTENRCMGCKTESRMAAGCPFITCALKRKGIEFCWDCSEKSVCERWKKHRAAGKKGDSFKCYQRLDDDIAFVEKKGVKEFYNLQKRRERILKSMLDGFNEGRSKSYYCIAATVMEIDELENALAKAEKGSAGLDIKERAKLLHSILDEIAKKRKYTLKLRN